VQPRRRRCDLRRGWDSTLLRPPSPSPRPPESLISARKNRASRNFVLPRVSRTDIARRNPLLPSAATINPRILYPPKAASPPAAERAYSPPKVSRDGGKVCSTFRGLKRTHGILRTGSRAHDRDVLQKFAIPQLLIDDPSRCPWEQPKLAF